MLVDVFQLPKIFLWDNCYHNLKNTLINQMNII